MARRGRTFRSSGSSRLTQWFRAADVGGYTSLAAGTAVLDQSLSGLTEPVTAVRVRGQISCLSDQTATNETPFGAVGMCVVTDQAFAIGVTAVPTPITDADSDVWIMHQYWNAPVNASTDIGFSNISQIFAFDSKAMRKVPEGSRLIWVVENASSAFAALFVLEFAVLIKLA